jgi:hypothetical protein
MVANDSAWSSLIAAHLLVHIADLNCYLGNAIRARQGTPRRGLGRRSIVLV